MLISLSPPNLPWAGKASNFTRIDCFWLPGKREDSPEGWTPTSAITINATHLIAHPPQMPAHTTECKHRARARARHLDSVGLGARAVAVGGRETLITPRCYAGGVCSGGLSHRSVTAAIPATPA